MRALPVLALYLMETQYPALGGISRKQSNQIRSFTLWQLHIEDLGQIYLKHFKYFKQFISKLKKDKDTLNWKKKIEIGQDGINKFRNFTLI